MISIGYGRSARSRWTPLALSVLATACALPIPIVFPSRIEHHSIRLTYAAPRNHWANYVLAPYAWLMGEGTDRPGFEMRTTPGHTGTTPCEDKDYGEKARDVAVNYLGVDAMFSFDIDFHCVCASASQDAALYLEILARSSDPITLFQAQKGLLEVEDALPGQLRPRGTKSSSGVRRADAAAWSQHCEVQFYQENRGCLVGLSSVLPISATESLLIQVHVDSYFGSHPATARRMARAFDEIVDSIELAPDPCCRTPGACQRPR